MSEKTGGFREEDRRQAMTVLRGVNRVMLGKEGVVQEVFLTFLAGGHVLLEDIPGVGKTTLARAFARAISLNYRRVQFTPDVLPSDITGFSVYHRGEERFIFQEGAVFTNLLLADELNRTSPKTQSALLEAMQERQVTVDGVTHALPEPFLVIATQNPHGAAGTQLLPDSETDRFAVSLTLGYPDKDSEVRLAVQAGTEESMERLPSVIGTGELQAMQEQVKDIYVSEPAARYAVELVERTRAQADFERGGSPRATIWLVRMAKAAAWLAGRDYVMPADIEGQFLPVMRHRVILTRRAEADGTDIEERLAAIAAEVKKPGIGVRPR